MLNCQVIGCLLIGAITLSTVIGFVVLLALVIGVLTWAKWDKTAENRRPVVSDGKEECGTSDEEHERTCPYPKGVHSRPCAADSSYSISSFFAKTEDPCFNFEGRSRRKEYWMWLLWCTLFVHVLLAIPVYSLLFTKCPTESLRTALVVWGIISGVVMGLMTLPVCVRRLHDRNMSGWWLLLLQGGMLIPNVNVFAVIAYFVIVGCLDGTVGPNDYGEDPKGRTAGASAPVSVATHSAPQGMSETPDAQLVKIKELYEKGLLTEDEYNRKRADIIAEI